MAFPANLKKNSNLDADRDAPALAKVDAEQLALAIESAWKGCRESVQAGDKDSIRLLHNRAKAFDSEVDRSEVLKDLHKFRHYFRSPAAIDPTKIDPILVPVRQRTLEARLFRIIRAFWSMPYSKGYGRRMRFIVFDAYHNMPIGIIGLQSPSADLACRDEYLAVGKKRKLEVVNSTMDAFSIGATPTYAPLLGGKLVAGLLHSRAIQQEYWQAYASTKSIMSDRRLPQTLLAITTSSAFGRSSIYNRLKMRGVPLAKPIGYTKGYGTIHLEELYPKMVEWLKHNQRHIPAGFGNGPKVRWQNVMNALIGLGVDRACLLHGIKREVFLFELVNNLSGVIHGDELPVSRDFDDGKWTEYWKERWCLPRIHRNSDWLEVDVLGQMRAAISRPPITA